MVKHYKSKTIETFTGWLYSQKKEKWFGNTNCLVAQEYNSNFGREVTCNIRKNLQGIQVLSFIYEDTPYYVIDIKFNGGYYKYPTIKEDWIKVITHYSFLVNEDELNTFLNPTENIIFITKTCVEWWEGLEDEDDVIRKLLDTKNNVFSLTAKERELVVKKYNNVIRFNYFAEYDFKDEWEKGFSNNPPIKMMEHQYFELSIEDWENLKKNNEME